MLRKPKQTSVKFQFKNLSLRQDQLKLHEILIKKYLKKI